jgi:hypothetical protein
LAAQLRGELDEAGPALLDAQVGYLDRVARAGRLQARSGVDPVLRLVQVEGELLGGGDGHRTDPGQHRHRRRRLDGEHTEASSRTPARARSCVGRTGAPGRPLAHGLLRDGPCSRL